MKNSREGKSEIPDWDKSWGGDYQNCGNPEGQSAVGPLPCNEKDELMNFLVFVFLRSNFTGWVRNFMESTAMQLKQTKQFDILK